MTTCAYIWVDRDFALARGWIQGFPKKLGSIWITRSFGLGGPADPGMEAGARFGVTCAAYERRVAEATVTLERPSGGGPFHNAAADRQRPPLPAPRRGKPRRARGARARPRRVARPVELRDLGGLRDARAVRRRRTRRSTRSRPSASGAATASRSPTRSTTSRPSVSSRTAEPRRGRGRRGRDRPLHRRRARRERRDVRRPRRRSTPSRSRRSRAAASARRISPSQAATEAFPGWAALGPDGRAAHLHRLADLIDANVERLAAVECADMAMLLRSLRARVIARGARNFRAYADLAVALRGAGLGVERDAQPRRADAERPGGRDHALERAVHALDLEDGARARGRLHGRAEARRVVAALVLAPLRPRRRGGLPAGRLQRRPGDRRGGRRRARRAIRASAGSRSPARPRPPSTSAPRRPGTSSRSPASWAARARCSSSPTATSRRRPGRPPASTTTRARCASRGRGCSSSRSRARTSSSSSSTASPTSMCSATRGTTRRPSRR